MSVYDLYQRKLGERDKLLEFISALDSAIAGLKGEEIVHKKALTAVEELTEHFRELASSQLTALLTNAIEDVFGEGNGCQLSYRKLQSGQYRPMFEAWDSDGITGNPTEVFGGSAVEIIALALRVYFLIHSGQPRLLVLDEPLRGIDSHAVHAVSSWLSSICNELDVQVIMVSHIGDGVYEGVADKTFLVEKTDGVSTVTEVTENETAYSRNRNRPLG